MSAASALTRPHRTPLRMTRRTPRRRPRIASIAQHPWLGLASFTEETRAYFYGREDEVAELARRVQRKLLTILFGQSGLGKTSILRAGIVPRLRPEGYCPVYVRVDYSPDSPAPSEQIKQAIFRATQRSGRVDADRCRRRRANRCGSSCTTATTCCATTSGKPLIPLLIFDQFEEIFTLAQADDVGRRRAAQFIEDLADLVENRAPKALEARMERDDSAVERFDFTRSDYRILIALREDYLAHLEGVEGRHALDHAEPDAPRADDRRAGARRRDEAGRQAGVARRSPRRSCASSPAARSCAMPRSSRRC